MCRAADDVLDEAVGVEAGLENGLDVGAEAGVACAVQVEGAGTPIDRQAEAGVEDGLDALPVMVVHRAPQKAIDRGSRHVAGERIGSPRARLESGMSGQFAWRSARRPG